jgi:FtsH-binding integral membrane protein
VPKFHKRDWHQSVRNVSQEDAAWTILKVSDSEDKDHPQRCMQALAYTMGVHLTTSTSGCNVAKVMLSRATAMARSRSIVFHYGIIRTIIEIRCRAKIQRERRRSKRKIENVTISIISSNKMRIIRNISFFTCLTLSTGNPTVAQHDMR